MNMSDRVAAQLCDDAAQQSMKHDSSPQRSDLTTAKEGAISFLTLPAELRNQIYEYVFQGWVLAIRPNARQSSGLEVDIWPDTISPYQIAHGHVPSVDKEPTNVFGLLYTNRQVYAETKFLPYGLNTVLFGEIPFPPTWLKDFNAQLAQVSSMQLCTHMPANMALSRTWMKFLPYFSGLRNIEIHWQLRVPPWGSEEDHLATAAIDEVSMKRRISKATSALCDISFHRTVIWD